MLRNTGIPLYYQISNILRRKIFNSDYESRKPIPSEDALAEQHGVSRITIRQALHVLETEGLITRHRGRGTFVSENLVNLSIPRFTGSIEDLVLMGIQTHNELLDFSWVVPSENIAAKLNTKDGKVLRVEKLRRTKNGPLSHVFNFLPEDIGRLVDKNLAKDKPMLVILEEVLKIQLSRAEQTVQATVADTRSAEVLDIRLGDPLLKTERTVFDCNSRPVEYVMVWYRADQFAYTMNLQRNEVEKNGWGTV